MPLKQVALIVALVLAALASLEGFFWSGANLPRWSLLAGSLFFFELSFL